MCILVTGGAGFIGSHIAERLLDLGHQVVVPEKIPLSGKTSPVRSIHVQPLCQDGHILLSNIKDEK